MGTKFRLDSLRKKMLSRGLDGILIFSKNNCNYISGFSGSNGYVFITHKESYLFTDSRYMEQARQDLKNWKIVQITRDFSSLMEVILEIEKPSIDNSVIGFESEHISFNKYIDLRNGIGDPVVLKPETYLLESIRAIKDLHEIDILTKSAELADKIMGKVLNDLKSGMTELEISNMIQLDVLNLNVEGVSFPTIIATGLNSAFPHHKPTEQVVENGDSLVIDMGILYQGYRSDISRTVFVGGDADTKFSEIYAIVLEAQSAAYNMSFPGVKGSYLDNIAREIIKSKGYGDYFTHGLGHGVGLEIHERPMLTSSSEDPIDVGAVFTIEPGIYIPNWGGIRIEDVFVMEQDGAKLLTHSPK